MGRNDQTVQGDIEDHFHQLFCRKTKNRPSIRRELPEVSQFRTNGLHHFKTWSKNESVYSSHLSTLGVDIAHFGRQNVTDPLILLSSI